MRRRVFIGLIGGAAALPTILSGAARAQGAPNSVIGLLHSTSMNYFAHFLDSVRQGLGKSGWIDGQNVSIEYRWADGNPTRLRTLAADLVGRRVNVLFTVGGSAPAQAAKAETSTIPIVFISAADPIKAGLVQSLKAPGGNVTGVSLIGSELEPKRLSLLHQLAPAAQTVGVLINPTYPDAERQRRELQEAAETLKQQIVFVTASSPAEIDIAFAELARQQIGAVLVVQDILFNTRVSQIVGQAARFKLPAIYNQREYPDAGGLISYGTSFAHGYLQAGEYLGRVLSGEKPAELPVLQPTRFAMVINLKTARALAIEIPPMLLALADEVIE